MLASKTLFHPSKHVSLAPQSWVVVDSHFFQQFVQVVVIVWNVQVFQLDVGRVEWELDSEAELGVHQEGGLGRVLGGRSLGQPGLDLPDEGGRHPLLELVRRRVQVQNLYDLRDLQLVAHFTNLLDVVVRLSRLEKNVIFLQFWLQLGKLLKLTTHAST